MPMPKKTITREFVSQVAELNAYLKDFSPYANNPELPEDEVLDALKFGVPNSWQTTNMVLQVFDPNDHTDFEPVAFCERHEFAEVFLHNSEDKNVAKPKPSPKGSDRKYDTNSFAEAYSNKSWHDTSECKFVQA
jgi:hypothetical protein